MSINLEPSGDAFFYALEILSSFHQPGAAQAQDSQPEGATMAAQPATDDPHDDNEDENENENENENEDMNNDENRDENRDPVTLTRAPTNTAAAAARPQGTIRSIFGASYERTSRAQSNGRSPLATIYLAPGDMPTFPRFPTALEISHISGHDELVLR